MKVALIVFVLVVLAGVGIYLLSSYQYPIGTDQDVDSPFGKWPPQEASCVADADCVLLTCSDMGASLVVHKSSLDYLDSFKKEFCDPVISNEGIYCNKEYSKCMISQENPVSVPNDNDILETPVSPQPFSDD